MLNQDDIKEIGLEVGRVIEHNITPQFQGVNERLDRVEGKLDRIENQMITKSYLDDKLIAWEGR